jgi:hypothetical protein
MCEPGSDTGIKPTCPVCGCDEISEVDLTRVEYEVEVIVDGGVETGGGWTAEDGKFVCFRCRPCSYESADIADFVVPDPGFRPTYEAWRHGGWYVIGVRHKNGGVGCVSRNYPDRKWRIVCDSRKGEHTYKSRDEAARAEHALVQAGVIE